MNKTVNINLAGVFFHIDEDAYLKLQRYLEAIKRSFTDSQGRSEIISDIEARIAELFTERIQNKKQVVDLKLVDDIITIMGQPEDYLVDDEIFEDETEATPRHSPRTSKKLFRDTVNSYIGGVAAGLGHYLGIDAIWIRLLWLILALGSGGTFIFIYLIFWALVPEAKTTAEKLTMTGEPVNISNIEKKIRNGIDTVSESVKNVDFKNHGSRLKSSSQSFFDIIGNIFAFFLKVAAKFIGILLIIIGVSSLLGLIVALFTVGITKAVHFPGMDFLDAANAANIPIWLMSMLLFFAISIPFFFVFYLGLKILVNNLKSIGNIAKFTLLGLWLMAIIGIAVIGIKQATEHAYDAKITTLEQELNITASDTLNLKMIGHEDYNRYFRRNHGNYHIHRNDNNNVISSNDIRLIVRSTTDSLASIAIKTFAEGSSYELAKQRAQNITYNYSLNGKTLNLDAFLTTDITNKFSNQYVEIILYLPEGTILYADDNTHNFHQNSSFENDLLKSGMEEHYIKVIKDDAVCLDCDSKTYNDNTKNDRKNGFIIDTSHLRLKVNKENGIDISIKNN